MEILVLIQPLFPMLFVLISDAGVMKSVMGELTDSTNRAEGFSLMPVVWALGVTLGCVI